MITYTVNITGKELRELISLVEADLYKKYARWHMLDKDLSDLRDSLTAELLEKIAGIVNELIADLKNRSGLGDVYYGMLQDTRDELHSAWTRIVRRFFRR